VNGLLERYKSTRRSVLENITGIQGQSHNLCVSNRNNLRWGYSKR